MNTAVERAVDILDFVAKSKNAVGLAEISRELSIPKSSAFSIVHTLVQKKFLYMDKVTRLFSLDLHAFEVGSAYLSGSEVHVVARPLLKQLNMQTGETIFLAVENNGMIVYLDKVEGKVPTSTTYMSGDRNLMHSTGLGKAILATKTIEEVRLITGGGKLQRKTERTIVEFNQLMQNLKEIRARGYSVDYREDNDFVFCVGAPVLNQDGEAIAAISISAVYTGESTLNNEALFGRLVMDAALELSRRFGYAGEALFMEE